MESPIVKFIEWFNSLPESHRMDIAFLVGLVIPFTSASELNFNVEKIDEKFLEIIKLASENPIKEVGVIYFLKPAIQQLIIDKHASDSSGKAQEQFLLQVYEKTGKKMFLDQVTQAQFKAKQWGSTNEKWNKLIESDLSEEKIREYFDLNVKQLAE